MRKKNSKPGVMVYFELLGVLPALSDREKGLLFEMILQYGRDGKISQQPKTRMLRSIWGLIKQRLDVDDARYQDVTARRKYAAYVRWSKKKNQEALEYDDWVAAGGLTHEQNYVDAEDALA